MDLAAAGTQFRDLAITSYARQIQNTTGGPNAWWEADGSIPSPNNIWAGNHAGPLIGTRSANEGFLPVIS